ncbi:Uncharacterised protein [Mycobacteroides abscessus]|nr:Uncharacterised protein [Mycobacteroides abscessus]
MCDNRIETAFLTFGIRLCFLNTFGQIVKGECELTDFIVTVDFHTLCIVTFRHFNGLVPHVCNRLCNGTGNKETEYHGNQ